MQNQIKCPQCGTEIKVDDVVINRVREQFKSEGKKEAEMEFQSKESTQLKQLQSQLFTEKQKREEAEKNELALLKREEELKDKEAKIELEIARRAEDQKKLGEQAAAAKYELMLAEERKKNEDTQKQLRELEQKSRQGSMQTQGEVLEITIEEALKQTFPLDKIEPVPKGINGADIIQVVYTNSGQVAGKIAWETKRTKNWTEEWVQKLKDDTRAVQADIAVLISDALPKEVQSFGPYKGVWICNYSIYLGVAAAMRNQLVSVASAITAETGKDQKMEAIYSYLTSNTFAQKIQALVETFDQMKQALDTEKRAMTKIWSTREVQITRLTENTAKMYGEIQGIAGAALPEIEILSLPNSE